MKNIKWFLILFAAACLPASCGSDSSDDPGTGPGNETGSVVGEWHMVSWSTLTAADIYLSFDDAGRFDLYQRLEKPTYEHFSGTYSYADGTLSGVYSDDVAWGNSYKVAFNADGSQMMLTGVNGSDGTAVFAQAAIPDEILSGELEASALQVLPADASPRFL